jgi:hypothetical protein
VTPRTPEKPPAPAAGLRPRNEPGAALAGLPGSGPPRVFGCHGLSSTRAVPGSARTRVEDNPGHPGAPSKRTRCPRREAKPVGPWGVWAKAEGTGGRWNSLPERTQYQFWPFPFRNEWLSGRAVVPQTNLAPGAPASRTQGLCPKRTQRRGAERSQCGLGASGARCPGGAHRTQRPFPNEPSACGAKRTQWAFGWAAPRRRAPAALGAVSPNEPNTSFEQFRSGMSGFRTWPEFPPNEPSPTAGSPDFQVALPERTQGARVSSHPTPHSRLPGIVPERTQPWGARRPADPPRRRPHSQAQRPESVVRPDLLTEG